MSQRNLSQKQKEQLVKKQKRQKTTAIALVAVVAVACVGGVGWTVYQNNRQQKEAEEELQRQIELSVQGTDSETVNVDPLREYLSTLDMELLNKDIAPEDTAEDAAVSEQSVSEE